MSRRAVGALVCALAVSLSASACSEGSGAASTAGSKDTGGRTTASASYGVPGVVSPDEVAAATHDYLGRLNAAIHAIEQPPHSFAPWEAADGGAVLAQDAYTTRAAANGFRTPDHSWDFAPPSQVYAPPSKTWPKDLLVATDLRLVGGGPGAPEVGGKTVRVWAFEQAGEGAPWKHVATGAAVRAQLPPSLPAGPEAVTSQADRDRAVELAQQLPAYWSGGAAPADFAGTAFVEEPRTWRADQLRRGLYRDIAYAARLFDGPASVHAYRAQGGVLVVASYRLETTMTAVRTLTWTEESQKAVWGAQPRPVLRRTEVAAATFFVPDTGKAQPLGYTASNALF